MLCINHTRWTNSASILAYRAGPFGDEIYSDGIFGINTGVISGISNALSIFLCSGMLGFVSIGFIFGKRFFKSQFTCLGAAPILFSAKITVRKKPPNLLDLHKFMSYNAKACKNAQPRPQNSDSTQNLASISVGFRLLSVRIRSDLILLTVWRTQEHLKELISKL